MSQFIKQFQCFWIAAITIFLQGTSPASGQEIAPFTYLVDYEMLLDFDGFRVYNATLALNNTRAQFSFQASQSTQDADLIPEYAADDYYQFHLMDTSQYFIQSDQLQNRVLHLERIPGSDRLSWVEEEMTSIEWTFTGRKKTIGQFECEEAIGIFRGREYSVWFSEKLPFTWGPWKLHGLPGLVLEASDSTGEVRYFATKVRPIVNAREVPELNDPELSVMSRSEYLASIRSFIERLERRMMSKFDRSFQVQVLSSPMKSIEIYE